MTKRVLENCPKCGREPEMRVSFGGPVAYYGIYCKCGNSNRIYPSALAAHGFGPDTQGFPPQDREESILEWNRKAQKEGR